METQFTLNDWCRNHAGQASAARASHFIPKNHVAILIFIFACICLFPFAKLQAQEAIHWSTSEISTQQINKECRYFAGDSLQGFNLSDTITKVVKNYSSYIELQSYLFQKEAAFVKTKYAIAQLPYEIAAVENLTPQNKILNEGCSNVDFEDGDFTGWTGGKGYNAISTNPLTIFNTGIFTLGTDAPRKSCSYHTMVTNASGNDYYGNYPVLCPNGGTYSVRLGGDNVNYYNGTDCNNLYTCSYPGPANPHHAAGEVLEQTFTVSASNTLFTFYYAADLNDGGHAPGEQAYFAIQVYDNEGLAISCFSHRIELVAGAVPPGGYLATNGNCKYSSTSTDYHVYSIPWQADSYNLTDYIGQTLTVKFTAAGCTLGGHFGIGYFDAKCGPAEIGASNYTPCSGQSVVLTAPPSASGMYSWTGPGIVGANNTQSITVNATGTYSVTVGTGTCSYPLSIIMNFNPSLNVSANPTTICSGQTATLTATGASTNYLWMPGNISGSTITVAPATSTVYTITGTSGVCSESSTVAVNVNATPTVTALASPNVICYGGTSTLSASGASTYNWSGIGSANPVNVTPLTTTTYTVTGTASNGCTSSNTTIITVNPLPGVIISSSNAALCFGSNNGNATANANSGMAPYNYNWSNGSNTATNSNLLAGNYSVTVTDNKGCTATTSVVITQPTQLTSVMSASTNVSCYGGNNGTASVVGNGGTVPYTYHWSNGANTSSVSSLVAGNYSVTVTDNNGCSSTSSIAITQPTQLITSVSSSVNVSCFGGNNGMASALANGGVAPYTFIWSNGANTANTTGLAAGNYSVTATDNKGCTSSASVIISQPVLLTSNISVSANVSCFGGNNGAAMVTPNGGTIPYAYHWSNGANTNNITGLPAGNYTVSITDINSCTSTASVAISQPTQLITTVSSSANVTCFGGNNGTASVTATGGTIPYNYHWSNGSTLSTINNLGAGTYSVTTTDNNGCTASASVVITQPTSLSSVVSPYSNVSCFSGNNGAATVTVNGGAAPYFYNWSNGANTAINSGLVAGNYSVTVTDNYGCTSFASVIITQPTLLVSSLASSTNVSCFGGNNGTASVTITGGSIPYTYNWSNGANTNNITGLSAGNYTGTVTDVNGCIATTSVVITQPTLLSSSISASNNVSCFGGNNGAAFTTVTGGIAPYSYNWSNAANTSAISNLVAGNFSVTVTDNNGCTSTDMVVITQPTLLITLVSPFNNVSCFSGNNGEATATVTGGAAPYIYNWSNGANTAVVNGLVAGNYSVTVTDDYGCTSMSSVVITQPALLASNVSASTNVSCFAGNNGTATVIANGGAVPYTYNWSNGANTNNITGLSAGNYSVIITDNNGCTSSTSVVITQPAILFATISASTNVSCIGGNNGTAVATVIGGTIPYSYNWSNGANTPNISGLSAGSYSISVNDNSGCSSSASIVITQSTMLSSNISVIANVSCFGGNNGAANVTTNGGVPPYTYNWSNGSSSSSINNLVAGNYVVSVTDNNGCSSTTSIIINQPALLTSLVSPYNNVSCFSGNNGGASVTVNGGTAPYIYNWSNSANTAIVNGLVAGNYSVTVTDNYGCTSMSSVVITQPTILASTVSASNNVSCFGGNNGIASVTVNGGIAPYTYNWSNGANTNSISGLSAGNYSVTASDYNGCTSNASIIITQPASLTSSALATNHVSCFGGINGAINATANGGTVPYSYHWSNGANANNITGLSAGNYTVTVTDINGCTSNASVVITQPSILTVATIITANVLCYGGNNGATHVSVNGGVSPYTYQWSNGANSSGISGLMAGNYSVTITDNNGCSATNIAGITQPSLLNSGISSHTNVSCYGGNNGAASVIAICGASPYSFQWSNGATTVYNSGLVAGNYSVTTTDNYGCTSLSAVIITQPTIFSASISSSTNVSCFGGNNGTASTIANGGTAPYTYHWSNGANTANNNGLVAGNYIVTVTDINNCISTASVIITQPTIFVSNISASTNISCFGGNNGTASVSANGGSGPYSYLWSNGSSTPTINGLIAGYYSASVTDNKGCLSVTSINLTQPGILTSSVSPSTNVSCFGGNNGTASIAANGGTLPYFYNWSNGANNSSISSLTAGSYYVTITDNNGCIATTSTVITQPTMLIAGASASNQVICFGGNNGMAIITVNGGSAPYSYNWSNGLNSVVGNSLVAGNYTITVTDYNSCTALAAVAITQPTFLSSVISSSTNVWCTGGTNGAATVAANGGTVPYVYHWSTGATTAHISGLTEGSYSVTVTDNNGCMASTNVTLTATTPITPNFPVVPPFCYGDNAPILANTSPNGISGSWSPPIVNDTLSGTYIFTPNTGLCANTQTLTIIVKPEITPNIINIPPLCSGSTAPPLTIPAGLTGWWNPASINNTQSGTYTFTPDVGQCATPQSLQVTIISQTTPNFAAIAPLCEGSIVPLLDNISPNGVYGSWNPSVVSNTNSGTYTFTPYFWECAIPQTVSITVIPQTVPTFTSIPSFCAGTTAPLLDNISTNGIGGTWNPPIINNNSSNIYSFTPSTGQCASNATMNVTVNPLPSLYASAFPISLCAGHNSVLTATGASSYLWMPGNITGSSISVAPAAATVYTVTGTSAMGCTSSVTLALNIAPEVPLYFSFFPEAGCVPLLANFDFISNGLIDTTSLHWDFGNPLTSSDVSTSQSPSYTYTNQGNYTVSLNALSVYGCPVTWTDTVTVWPKPVADFMTHPETGTTDNPLIYFYDQSLGATSWNWNFGDPTSGTDDYSSIQFPSHNYTGEGNYAVQLIVANDHNCMDTAVKVMTINESFVFYVPNAFTPNSDGTNEGFRGQGVGIDENTFEMYVFDRWGKELFKTSNLFEAWDGRSGNNNKPCEQALYVYLINLKDKAGEKHNYTGTVMLIR